MLLLLLRQVAKDVVQFARAKLRKGRSNVVETAAVNAESCWTEVALSRALCDARCRKSTTTARSHGALALTALEARSLGRETKRKLALLPRSHPLSPAPEAPSP